MKIFLQWENLKFQSMQIIFTWRGVGDRLLGLLSDLIGPAVGVEGGGGDGRRGEGPALEEVPVSHLAGARVDYDRH